MSFVESAAAAPARRRLGVDAGHAHYKWWALSCTSLGMLLATINSGTLIIALPDLERALGTSILSLVWVILAYMIASTVLVLTAGRLSDLFGRKQAYVGGFVVFALASLGAGFCRQRHRADPLADRPGRRRRLPVRELRRPGHRRVPARAARARDGDQHDGRRGRARDRAGARRACSSRSRGTGCSGSTSRSASPARSGARSILRELAKPDTHRGLDLLGTATFVAGLTGLVLGISKGGLDSWNDPVVIAGLAAAVVLLPLFVLIEHRSAAPMLDLTIFRNRLFAAATGAAFINGLVALRAAVRVRLLLPGRQGRRPDPRRDQARADGDRDADLLAAGRDLGGPQGLAGDGLRRDGPERGRAGRA